MKRTTAIGSAILVGALAGGAYKLSNESSPPTPVFDATPATDYMMTGCPTGVHPLEYDVLGTTSSAPKVGTEETIGVGSIEAAGNPSAVIAEGATILNLGNFVFKVATSGDGSRQPLTLNLNSVAFAEVLPGTVDDYTVMFSAIRRGNMAEFTIGCDAMTGPSMVPAAPTELA